jgi:hypothetical protein
MKKANYLLKLLAILPAICFFISCNAVENETDSSSILIVENIMGQDLEDNEANFLQSDVLYQDPTTGAETIHADIATATLRTKLLNPLSVTGPSQYNDIMLDRYVVTYFRSDGNNTEGVDVPYSFEGHISVNIPVDSEVGVSFVIVREVAKLEPPLVNLQAARDAGVLQVHAKVEFFGHDMANKNIKATGYLDVFFANYANESGG